MMGSVGQSQQDTTEAASIEVKIKRSSNGRAKWLQNLVFNASLASVYVYSLTAWFKPWHATFIESPSMNWSSFYETCLVWTWQLASVKPLSSRGIPKENRDRTQETKCEVYVASISIEYLKWSYHFLSLMLRPGNIGMEALMETWICSNHVWSWYSISFTCWISLLSYQYFYSYQFWVWTVFCSDPMLLPGIGELFRRGHRRLISHIRFVLPSPTRYPSVTCIFEINTEWLPRSSLLEDRWWWPIVLTHDVSGRNVMTGKARSPDVVLKRPDSMPIPTLDNASRALWYRALEAGRVCDETCDAIVDTKAHVLAWIAPSDIFSKLTRQCAYFATSLQSTGKIVDIIERPYGMITPDPWGVV